MKCFLYDDAHLLFRNIMKFLHLVELENTKFMDLMQLANDTICT